MTEDRWEFECKCRFRVEGEPLSRIPNHCPRCGVRQMIQWSGEVKSYKGPREVEKKKLGGPWPPDERAKEMFT